MTASIIAPAFVIRPLLRAAGVSPGLGRVLGGYFGTAGVLKGMGIVSSGVRIVAPPRGARGMVKGFVRMIGFRVSIPCVMIGMVGICFGMLIVCVGGSCEDQ